MKNEAEAYMLKELSLLKWREKASKLAHEDTTKRMTELQDEVSTLEANKKTERFFLYLFLLLPLFSFATLFKLVKKIHSTFILH